MEPINDQVVISLLNYIPLSGIEALRGTSKSAFYAIESNVGIGTVMGNLGTTNRGNLFSQRNKVGELTEAIKRDDVDAVLFILSYRRTPYHLWLPVEEGENDEYAWETLPSYLLPRVLCVAAMHKSSNVFAAVCPMIVAEIDRIDDVCGGESTYVADYIDGVAYTALQTSDPVIYKSIFTSLPATDVGTDVIYQDVGSDHVHEMGYFSYLHKLKTGDSSAYDILRKYYNFRLGDDCRSLYFVDTMDIVQWLLEEGYTKMCLREFVLHRSPLRLYLEGTLTYDETLTKLKERRQAILSKYIDDIMRANEL